MTDAVAPPAQVRARSGIRAFSPQRSEFPTARDEWTSDLVAGVTVGVVALPLALGFGVASGMGATAGLITAIVAGIVAATFGGSALQVSGPTGAMTVVLVPMIAAHGPAAVPVLAIVAGVIVVGAALLGLGRAVMLIPWPVVEGFTLGIAIIIFLQQFPLLLDTQSDTDQSALGAAIHALTSADWHSVAPAIALGGGVAVWLIACRRARPAFPASLLGVIGATVVCVALDVDVPTIGAISLDGLHLGVRLPDSVELRELLSSALVVAVLAALESLLSSRVADGMSDAPPTDPDRELFGQGLANIASGLVGGMPATGAIARTAVNVRAGARTRAAALTHGVVLALIVLVAAPLVSRIPLAALAGVLMVTAARMVERSTLRTVRSAGRSDVLIFTATMLVTVLFDLVLAVEIGVAISIVLALRAVAGSSGVAVEHVDQHSDYIDDAAARDLLHRHVVVYRLEGSLFFGAAQRFLEEITALDRARVVVLRLGQVQLIDSTGAHAIAESIAALRRRGVDVLLCGVQLEHRQILEAVGVPGACIDVDRIFSNLPSALAEARLLAAR